MAYKAALITLLWLTPVLLHAMEQEIIPLIPDKNYSINNPEEKTRSYTCCPNTYAVYPCTERACCAIPSIAPALCCLGVREVASEVLWAQNESTSFVQAHTQMWCSREAWFPWCCDTRQEVCTSIVGNCATATTLISITYALCIFLPCVTKTGCTFSKNHDALENEK